MDGIEQIKERNKRVELDKAWESSWTRRIFLAIITFVIVGIGLGIIGSSNPWLEAFVATTGYILSTLSLGFIKKWWISKQ